MNCTRCGYEHVRPTARFCPRCGVPISPAPLEAEQGVGRDARSLLLSADLTASVHEGTRDFTGRAWVFQAIDAWLAKSTSRVFLLTGGPGSGKTSLATRLLQMSQGRAEQLLTAEAAADVRAALRALDREAHGLRQWGMSAGTHVISWPEWGSDQRISTQTPQANPK